MYNHIITIFYNLDNLASQIDRTLAARQSSSSSQENDVSEDSFEQNTNEDNEHEIEPDINYGSKEVVYDDPQMKVSYSRLGK